MTLLDSCTVRGQAEYIALAACGNEAIVLRRLLDGIGRTQTAATSVYEDNTGAIKLAGRSTVSQRRHIDIKYHSIRDQIKDGQVVLKKIDTKEQLADGLTKHLDRFKLAKFVTSLKGH